jgi:hypothetical protein
MNSNLTFREQLVVTVTQELAKKYSYDVMIGPWFSRTVWDIVDGIINTDPRKDIE